MNAIWAYLGQTGLTVAVRVANVVLVAAMTISVARVLQPARFGDYAFVLALITIASVPVTAGMRNTLARETAYARAQNNGQKSAALFAWALRWGGSATLLVAAGVAAVALWGVTDAGLSRQILVGLVFFLLLPFSQMFGGVLQGCGRVVQSQIPEFLIRPAGFLLILFGLWAILGAERLSVELLLWALAAAAMLDILVGAWLLRRSGAVRRPEAGAQADLSRRALMISAMSFGAIASAYLINSNLDVVMLGMLDTSAGAGTYKTASTVADLVVFGLGAINTVLLPRIATLHATGDRDGLQRLLTWSARLITAFALGTAAVLVVGGEVILALVFGEGFSVGYPALVILVLGQLANAVFGSVALVLNMTGNERWTLLGLGLSVIANAALNLMLIPPFGIIGAAIATASSLVVWNVLLTVVVMRCVGVNCTVFRRFA